MTTNTINTTYTLTNDEIRYLSEYRNKINPLFINNAEYNLNPNVENAQYIVNIPVARPVMSITPMVYHPEQGQQIYGIERKNAMFNYRAKMCIILFCVILLIPLLIIIITLLG